MSQPESIEDIEQLEELLSRPSARCLETVRQLDGDVLVLGAGGKMGPTVTRMVRRALSELSSGGQVIAVSRFHDVSAKENLEASGVRVLQGDLLDAKFVQSLPRAAHVIYLAGAKFGTLGNESLTWATNAFLPGLICETFRDSRIVALSTGNVYGLTHIKRGGSRESDELAPVGEYAMSCLGRERVFEHFSRTRNMSISIIRLNYANELRYGVLVDIARQVWQQQPVDLSMGYVNVIWQGDANSAVITALETATCPPAKFNLTGAETLSVRHVAQQFGELWGKPIEFVGTEPDSALLSNSSLAQRTWGAPQVSVDQMMHWIADWVQRGGTWWGKPTHFSNRNGTF